MAPPGCACGASPRGPEGDSSSPQGQRERPGRAGSAASAWLIALAISAAGSAFAAPPAIERATKGERCVEDTASMRRNHMRFLEHQRDATVHGGIRGAKHSLKGCIDCHTSKSTGSVAQAKTDFCVACHAYTAVKIDCFDCHATRPAAMSATVGEARK